MNKKLYLLLATFLLFITSFVFALDLVINVTPAGVYSGTLYRYEDDAGNRVRVGSGSPITTDGSGQAVINFPDILAGNTYYWGLEISGKAENFANQQVYLEDATAITLVAPVTNIYFDAIDGYTLSGQLQDLSGTPLGADIEVELYEPGYTYRYATTTNASGNYSFPDIVPGDYFIKAGKDSSYFPLWYSSTGGAYGDYAWTTINVLSSDVSGLNFNLPGKATVAGNVSSSGGNLSGMEIHAFFKDGNFDYVNDTTSDGSGNYSLEIPADTNLMIRAKGGTYIDTFYNQVDNWGDATTLNLASGGSLSSVDFTMTKEWTISGNVNVPGALVEVFGHNDWSNSIDQTNADANGNYVITGTGNPDIMLRFSNGNNYVEKIYPDLLYFSNIGDTEKVTTNEDMGVKELDPVTLEQAGSISGTLTIIGGTGSIVTINIENTDGTYFTSVTKNQVSQTLAYTLYSVPTGDWLVKAIKDGCVSEYYGETTATSSALHAVVTALGNTNGVDIEIGESWTVTGQVLDKATMLPVSGIEVAAFQSGGWSWIASDTTDAQGIYEITGGYGTRNIFVNVAAQAGYQPMIWNNHVNADYGDADLIAIAPGDITANINFQLYQTSTINGTITYDGSGSPVSGAAISVYEAETQNLIAKGYANSSGVYNIGDIPPGNIKLLITGNAASSEYYNDIPATTANAWSLATTVSIGSGVVITGYSAGLEQSWRIAGVVDLSDSASPAGAQVVLLVNGNTPVTLNLDSSGVYEFSSTENVADPVTINYLKNNYETATRSVVVVLGVTDISNLDVTLQALQGQIPSWYTSTLDSIKVGPNPANPDEEPVHIGFVVDQSASARILLYSMGGELVFSERMSVGQGYHEFVWDGGDRFSQAVANGVYLAYLEIKVGGKRVTKVKKIAILR